MEKVDFNIQTLQQKIDDTKKSIINDSDNLEFTEQNWVPIFQAFAEAKIVIIGPAPGIKTQLKEESFRDKSGERLRDWMGIDETVFYDSRKIAVLPLDFYFPGKAKVGDLPPRVKFAKKWHPKLLSLMPNVELIILMGVYAQKFYLKSNFKGTLTKTVFSYQDFSPKFFPLAHSSPLNYRWLNKNPNFERKIVPELKIIIHNLINE